MLPSEDEPVDNEVSFLVEARSRSGYSGSPVFLYYSQHSPKHDMVVMDFENVKLLGVDWGHLPEKVQLKDPGGYLDGAKRSVEVHSGMMGVVPAWYLRDLIENSPELIEQRRRDDEYYCTNPPIGRPDV